MFNEDHITAIRPNARFARLISSGHRDESGIAIAFTALLGAVFVLLSVIIIVRAVDSYGSTNTDRSWEEALLVAESGGNIALFELEAGADLEAYYTVSGTTDLSTRDAIVAAADALTPTATPDGEFVIVKPEGQEVLYSVGYTPTQAAANRKVRVVEMEYSPEVTVVPNWSPEMAFLSGGNLDAASNASGVIDATGNSEAHIHANGDLYLHGSFGLDGCATGDGNDLMAGTNCPPEPVFVPVPNVVPTDIYYLSQTDLCPDGSKRGGPAHLVSPNLTGVPCQGPLVAVPGWTFSITPGKGTLVWNPSSDVGDGVVYIHHASIAGTLGKNSGGSPYQLAITIITSSSDETGNCLVNDGHITLDGQSWTKPHPDAGDITLVAGGDVNIVGGASTEGLVMAHEQVQFSGNSGTGGAAVAESACDSVNSPVSPDSRIAGNSTITYGGALTSPFSVSFLSGGLVLDDLREVDA